MNLDEMMVVVCWKFEEHYDGADLETYAPLIVPLGSNDGDVRELVRHVYGEDAEFESYRFPSSEDERLFQSRGVMKSPAERMIVISDPKGSAAPICWAATEISSELLANAKSAYPGWVVDVSRVVQAEVVDRKIRYFVLG